MANTVTINQLQQIPLGEIAALPVRELARLQHDAAEATSWARAINDLLNSAMTRRFGDQAAAIRRVNGKEFGVIRFQDGDAEIVADQGKKVNWDQQKLTAIAARIVESGKNPDEYIKTTRAVDERKFSAWPSDLKEAFLDARTVRCEKQTFKIEITE
ncbi:MAG: hypothetical protein HQL74_13125 [Magnetococcales bacterium]|nr:hypothetical protein [Magnetococcales bacterium]MBF0423271.1 hypothetical protein [Magnetococcales bacterium]